MPQVVPKIGARPLKRVTQRELQNPLALHLLDGTIREGEAVYVDVAPDGGELVFSEAQVAQAG